MCLLTDFGYQKNYNQGTFLMNWSIKNGGYAFLIRLNLMFSVFMKKVPIVTNFKQLIYQTFN